LRDNTDHEKEGEQVGGGGHAGTRVKVHFEGFGGGLVEI
jgi:hypothetical protein